MCIRDSSNTVWYQIFPERFANGNPNLTPDGAREWDAAIAPNMDDFFGGDLPVSYTHLRAHETRHDLVCRLLLYKKKKKKNLL